MFSTFITSAAVIVLTATSFQTPALASNTSASVRDHRTPVETTVRDHRTSTKTTVRDHREHRNNEIVKVSRKDCRVGYEFLRRSGYENIAILDCQGTQYSYMANKDRGIFGAKMNAYSGKVDLTYLGSIHTH
ncbi:MAG: hypothetical protein ABJQ71_07160 [Roseibium sp.]